MLLGGNGVGVPEGMLACIHIALPENELVRCAYFFDSRVDSSSNS